MSMCVCLYVRISRVCDADLLVFNTFLHITDVCRSLCVGGCSAYCACVRARARTCVCDQTFFTRSEKVFFGCWQKLGEPERQKQCR